jgi:hypothetical protein
MHCRPQCTHALHDTSSSSSDDRQISCVAVPEGGVQMPVVLVCSYMCCPQRCSHALHDTRGSSDSSDNQPRYVFSCPVPSTINTSICMPGNGGHPSHQLTCMDGDTSDRACVDGHLLEPLTACAPHSGHGTAQTVDPHTIQPLLSSAAQDHAHGHEWQSDGEFSRM